MKINKPSIVLCAIIICACFNSLMAQRMSPEDMVTREKQNVYKELTDLSKEQKELMDGIYDEFTQTFKETMDEVRKTRSYDQMRVKMEGLRTEKDGLVADVLNDSQFAVYQEAAKNRRAGAQEEEKTSEPRKKWSVQGILADGEDGSEIIGATVRLLNIRDSTKSKYAVTDIQGSFAIKNVEDAFYRLTITSMGYLSYTKVIRVGAVDMNLGRIFVKQDAKMLEAIEVKGEVVAMEKKGDTLQYNADAYKVNNDASTKDLVSKMPGIVVDGSGVSANGETVQQVLLDGKRFFGQDPLLSLNTIPAEVVKNIQVFDQKSEQSQFTGIDDGNTTKTMNVVTKEGKRNGKFGKIYGGYGTDDHYHAGVNLNSFDKDRRITVIGMSNNVNIQNFSSEDLAGVGGGGGRRGGSRGGGSDSFMTGTQDGITKTNSFGMNFTDKLGEKATLESSYFFNKTDNNNNEFTNRQFASNGSDYYSAENRSDTDNLNHRMNMRINYDINENNRLVIRPSISYQDNKSRDYSEAVTRDENGEIIKETQNNYQSFNKSYNISNDIDFQHKFGKIGRTFSFELNNRIQDTDRKNYQQELLKELDRDSLTNYEYLTEEKQYSYNAEVTYSEPVGANSQLSLQYEIDYNDRTSDKQAFIVDEEQESRAFNSELSNEFESGYTTHKTELSLTNRSFGQFFRAEVAFQHAILNSDQYFPEAGSFNRKFDNILPSLMGRLNFKGGGDMFFRYSGDTDAPSVSQLQNVVDRSNTLLWSLGNPDLKQSYSHSFFMRMGKSNIDKNTSISNYTRVETTLNYVTNETQFANQDMVIEGVEVPRGTQISRPINSNGYWNATNSTTYGMPITKLKSNLNSTIGVSYRRQPGYNNEIENFASTYSGSAKLSLVSNFSKDIDFNIYYSASTNTVVNSAEISSNSNSSYLTQTLGGKFNLTFWKGLVFRSDVFYQKYNGVNDAFNTAYTLWNLSIAKKFLKNNLGELELSVFDLLKQNRSVSQSVTSTYLQETRTQVLQQYFMLTFSYQLRKFKASK